MFIPSICHKLSSILPDCELDWDFLKTSIIEEYKKNNKNLVISILPSGTVALSELLDERKLILAPINNPEEEVYIMNELMGITVCKKVKWQDLMDKGLKAFLSEEKLS